jgi:hypothetical protein
MADCKCKKIALVLTFLNLGLPFRHSLPDESSLNNLGF